MPLKGAGCAIRSLGPLYRSLARILGELIEEGQLAPAVGLPPERDLAEQLGIGRITVRKAYKELPTQGFVESRAAARLRC